MVYQVQKFGDEVGEANKSFDLGLAIITIQSYFFCGCQLRPNLGRSQIRPSTLLFYGFQLHFVGESPLTGQDVFALQIAVHHLDYGFLVAHVPHDHR